MSELEVYTPPNQGPRLDGFVDSVALDPGKSLSLSLGKPFDVEGDEFYFDDWRVQEGPPIPWIQHNNKTSLTSIDFSFNPPTWAQGSNLTLEFVLQDKDVDNPAKAKYEVEISVAPIESTFVPDFEEETEEVED